MKATIWHNPKCGTSRKTKAILEETPGIELSVVEYLKNPPERAKLEQLYRDAGITPRQGLRLRGSPAEEMGLTDEDATAARRLLSTENFELVLVDLELPSLGFFARLLNERTMPPVLGLRRPEAEVCMHEGIDGWLHKPPEAELLQDMIERQLLTPLVTHPATDRVA